MAGTVTSGARPKVYELSLVARVEELYASGLTQAEVGRAAGISQKVVWNLMRRHSLPTRVAAKRNQKGSNNDSWKGEAAGYQAKHLRVETARGKPSECARCESKDDPTVTYDWANLTGNYGDVNDFERMCRSCHRRYDNQRRQEVMQVA